jgi:competence protein ComFB
MSQKLSIKNYMEDCVWNYLDEILIKFDHTCKCDICRYDMVALALNNLPPKYVVHEFGEIYTKLKSLEMQYLADIYAEITKAIVIVSQKPRHD